MPKHEAIQKFLNDADAAYQVNASLSPSHHEAVVAKNRALGSLAEAEAAGAMKEEIDQAIAVRHGHKS